MKRKMCKKLIQDGRGFSLLEVLLGISVFMIGMLGVTALNISSLKSNTFSGNTFAARKARTSPTAMRAARSRGKRYTPQLTAGKAIVRRP